VGRWLAAICLLLIAGLSILGWLAREDHRRSERAATRQTDEATRAAREAVRIGTEAERKVHDILDLHRSLIERPRDQLRPPAETGP